MPVDRQWALRNLGIDEAAVGAAEGPTLEDDDAVRRDLIDFDSESAQGHGFRGIAAGSPPSLDAFVDINWPTGLEPKPGGRPTGQSLPKADVLIATWTMDEGHALSRVLTPGFDSRDDWVPYTKNFGTISKDMRVGCPARNAKRLGTFWTTQIGGRQVTLFKSDSHMSQDGPKLPNAAVWSQIIRDCSPSWVITTGTGGGIGPALEVGDVVASRFVSFDCSKQFKALNGQTFSSPSKTPNERFSRAKALFAANAQFLPSDNKRPPRIVSARSRRTGIATTDFFGFDNTDNTYGLQGHGDLSEMGDAVLGMVCSTLGSAAPSYVIVRNVSDPQIDSTGLTIAQQRKLAADIYKGYGRWSSVCSAIVCWAIVAGI
jgi:nucleoside phosphorylase